MQRVPKVTVDILVKRDNRILLGFLSKKWSVNSQRSYGLPGRDIAFRETIGEAVRRIIKEEINCTVTNYTVICVNANYELGNHYISIGVIAEIKGEPQLLKPEDWEKWEWFPLNQLPENLFISAKHMIECYRTGKFIVSE